ncbi:MAG: peptide-methionine (S)-S-oxide reductase MsrA [Candidatus Eremiobacteraeota bacterium]|nr:peptide-methionine (S)-S-oxide reductase MsrA [Candidatus Eremiobacteraeota bacterium]
MRRSLVLAAALAWLAAIPVPPAAAAPSAAPRATRLAVFAGGCFWGMEAVFESLRGVTNVVSGFAGGSALTAHYAVVSTGTTGHAESVAVTYDPRRISYAQLLDVYFRVAHDPTQRDRQGPDEGTQYRSAIFYTDAEQKRLAEAAIRSLTAAHTFSAPIVTEVVPLHGFYAAEDYHQHYLAHHPDEPYIVANDLPKLRALRARYPALVATNSVAMTFGG